MTIEEFKKSKKPKKTSSLEKFRDDIFELKKENFSQSSIVEYLKKNNVKTTQQNISYFLKNKIFCCEDENIKKDEKIQNKTEVKESQTQKKQIVIKSSTAKIKNLEIEEPPDWAR